LGRRKRKSPKALLTPEDYEKYVYHRTRARESVGMVRWAYEGQMKLLLEKAKKKSKDGKPEPDH